jgi:hypothetical protein
MCQHNVLPVLVLPVPSQTPMKNAAKLALTIFIQEILV